MLRSNGKQCGCAVINCSAHVEIASRVVSPESYIETDRRIEQVHGTVVSSAIFGIRPKIWLLPYGTSPECLDVKSSSRHVDRRKVLSNVVRRRWTLAVINEPPPPPKKKLSRRTKLTILATVDVRPTSLAVQLYRAERPAVYLQHDVRNAARRAGPSAAAETRRGSGAHEAPRVQRPIGSRRMRRCARALRPYAAAASKPCRSAWQLQPTGTGAKRRPVGC